jgi:hypothetical protein
MRYICANFSNLALDAKISYLKFDQLVMILKNKFVGITSEDIVINAIENWMVGNPKFS